MYDEIYKSNTLLSDIVSEINDKSKGYEFEYTVRDSAAAREGTELLALGIRTIKADKHSRGLDGNDMSNRRA